MTDEILHTLAGIIQERRQASSEKSYTKSLLEKGPEHIARKFGEEAVELVIALCSESDKDVRGEAADVLYHLMVGLESRDIAVSDVLEELKGRMGMSGIEEKARRPQTKAGGPGKNEQD